MGFVLGVGAAPARANTLWLVSAECAALRPGERIVGFELIVSWGRITALPTVPIGWNVAVDNAPSGQARVSGAIQIGAAALDPRELKGFAVVEGYGSGAGQFDVELILSVTADFTRERHIRLPKDQLGLYPR